MGTMMIKHGNLGHPIACSFTRGMFKSKTHSTAMFGAPLIKPLPVTSQGQQLPSVSSLSNCFCLFCSKNCCFSCVWRKKWPERKGLGKSAVLSGAPVFGPKWLRSYNLKENERITSHGIWPVMLRVLGLKTSYFILILDYRWVARRKDVHGFPFLWFQSILRQKEGPYCLTVFCTNWS